MPAVVVLVGLQAIASLLLLALLRLLFGRSPWVLVPFAAYLFTPLGLATATWLAAGLQAFPLQIALLGATIGLVRYLDTGRVRWAVVWVAAHALGLLFWQKAGLVLPRCWPWTCWCCPPARRGAPGCGGCGTRLVLARPRRAARRLRPGLSGRHLHRGPRRRGDRGLAATLHDVLLRTLLRACSAGPGR